MALFESAIESVVKLKYIYGLSEASADVARLVGVAAVANASFNSVG